MEAIITRNMENVAFIPLTHVYQPTIESDEAWGVHSQCLSNSEIPIRRNILWHM
jgi:hypothetical protein